MSTALAERSGPAGASPAREPAPGSAIYEGWVTHRRRSPVEHSLRYRVFMPLVDVDRLTELLDPVPLWSARRRAPARYRRSDYLRGHGDDRPLGDAVRDLVAERTGSRPDGPVLMLANPRYWGVGFNPVSFYFAYGGSGIEAMVAEVTNTPWGQRRCYVLPAGPDGLRGEFAKRLHVSPFMPMDQTYEWSASAPGERLAVTISNRDERGETVFTAGLALERRELSPRALGGILFRYPPMTASTLARIYLNAARLKLKGAPYFSPPADRG
ncbi:MAG: DUF1365 domain-containing protein [Solirubrobacterales bacterium]